MSLIEIKNLTHIYGIGTGFEEKAIDNVSLSIEKGEFIGIIGAAGSGKSTLIKHINGLIKPTSGKVLIDNKDIFKSMKSINNIRRRVGIVFQYPECQLFDETVYKDISFGPKNMGLTADEINKRVHDAMDFIGLREDLLDRSPFELSGGEQRKVAIAGVIAMMPDILVLDEPAAGLDPISKDNLLFRLNEYHKKQNNTVILVSHSMQDVAKFSDRVVVMNNGKVHMFDKPQIIFNNASYLENIGLCVPQITQIMMKLKDRGFNVSDNVYTLEDALENIKKLVFG